MKMGYIAQVHDSCLDYIKTWRRQQQPTPAEPDFELHMIQEQSSIFETVSVSENEQLADQGGFFI